MVDVICDTNFLIHLATKRIKNFDNIITEIGSLSFLVPNVVYSELITLKNNPKKQFEIDITLEYIKKFQFVSIDGKYADKEILNFIKLKKSIIGTMDKELKRKIKLLGSSVVSFKNDNLVLEN